MPITQKWRPGLLLVLGGTLGVVVLVPSLGLLAMPRLIAAFGLGYGQAVLLFAGVMLGIALALGYLLRRLLLRPITELAGRAQMVKSNQPGALNPLAHYGTQELHLLGEAVLDMAQTLHSREAGIRTYSNHITHELKSPLTAIMGAAELLESESLQPDSQRLLETITQSAARMEVLLSGLQQIAAAREPSYFGQTCLDDIAEELRLSPLNIIIEGGQITLPISADGMQLVLGHMLENALDHMATAIRLSAKPGPMLVVSDNGSGISKGNQPKVFDPFFTTRRELGGTGMGLSISQSLLRAHGGQVSLLKSASGTRFEIGF